MDNGYFHITLDEDGLPDQWIDIVDIALKSPKQIRRLRSIPTTAEGLAALNPDEARAAASDFLVLTVKAWNVLDPDTGTALPSPATDGFDPEAVPSIVTARIGVETRSRMQEIQNLQPRSGRG